MIRTKLIFRPERLSESPRGHTGCFLQSKLEAETLAVANVNAIYEGAKIEVTAAVIHEETENQDARIFLLRSFNGMPLTPAAASACLLTNSLRYFFFYSQNTSYTFSRGAHAHAGRF